MGTPFSKKITSSLENGGCSSSSGGGLMTANMAGGSTNSLMEFTREFSTYQTDCQQDPALRTFDAALQQRTVSAISVLAASGVSSVSFQTLQQVTGCLLDNDREVVKLILEYKKDIWKNPEIFDLVEEYLDNSLLTLDFCSVLEKCIQTARESQLVIQVALKMFEDEEGQSEGEDGTERYKRTLEELHRFRAAGDPFTQEFFQAFQSVFRKQASMLEKLKQKKKKLDKKLKTAKVWRRVSGIIFASAIAAVVICAIMAAVMAAPPVAAALAAAASIPLGSVGKWVDSLWKGYTDVLQEQMDVLSTMQVGASFASSDLQIIQRLVDRLKIQISSLLQSAEFALREEEAVKFGIEEIKKKLGEFTTSIESLGKQVDQCSRHIQRARTAVVHKMLNK